jgi:hypothetical protein
MTFKAIFPEFLASAQSGHGVRGAKEAVSGCNILIFALDASVLPALWAARITPETAGFGRAYFRLGAG